MDSCTTQSHDYCGKLGRESDNNIFHFSPVAEFYRTTMTPSYHWLLKSPAEVDALESDSKVRIMLRSVLPTLTIIFSPSWERNPLWT